MTTKKKFSGSRHDGFRGRFRRMIRYQLLIFFFFFTSAPWSYVSARSFEVYIETNYKNQPDLSKYGAKKLAMSYVRFWSKGQDRQLLPSKDRVVNYVTGRYANYTGLLVLDLEHWPLLGSDERVAERVNKFITLWEWVKSAAPQAKVGYYSVVPTPGYWPCQKPGSAKYIKWQKKNDRAQALADRVDAFFPSLYPVEADQSKWVRYAACHISEARRLGKGKPIYPFINPRYHSKAYDRLAFKKIPEDFIALQLKTLSQGVSNGVVIWGAANAKNQWSESLPWWQATKQFLGLK